MKYRGFGFNRSKKIIGKNLRLKENNLKSDTAQDDLKDLIVKIIEIAKFIKAQMILDRAKSSL
ncbi:conserved hypothetical protein (plasmid) [Borreliella burgdorferi 29805]|uniref:hypothetical protein n=1 Tax=Borreliella burgdorferi TaxID=139 RepID=UPI00017F4863|nr:hypothetical protein [Borreliella burgdorferi]ACO38531.1 conserved hypothetical protein [Borreliella burgdorferi 29805]MCD2376803.1 hypothetical protein [Borreliella burgdorferi]MCD2381608.1 hypothetical protein [Borreliella burgdorferi]MCD2388645.1 hypothetical protein [Borreliella burgdorferi]MCD2392411.1 hypothetical protein [Borreliella burgdorferi]